MNKVLFQLEPRRAAQRIIRDQFMGRSNALVASQLTRLWVLLIVCLVSGADAVMNKVLLQLEPRRAAQRPS